MKTECSEQYSYRALKLKSHFAAGALGDSTGARCVRKKKNKKKILYNTTRGRTRLLPFF
jgi:hypothetical protein